MTKEMCHAIRKPGDGTQGYGISKLSVSRLKLLSFYAKHMWRTSRGINEHTGPQTIWIRSATVELPTPLLVLT
jgi:hypothetical protein